MSTLIDYKNFATKSLDFPKSKILKIDNFLETNSLKEIKKEVSLLSKISEVKKFHISGKSNKFEYLDYSLYGKNSLKLIEELSGEKFIKFLQKQLDISDDLFPDHSNGYSGFNVVKKDGFLKTHADFNYNNNLKKFRTINLLVYLNSTWKDSYGGNLSMYDYSTNKKKYTFLAKNNRCIIFITNKFTPHGYKKITTNKDRLSLNFYYYTDKNYSYSALPHKTLWR